MLDASTLPHVAAADVAAMVPPATSALIVVDVQTDFAAPFGLIGRHGADMSTVEPAIDRIETLIDAARTAGVTIGFMRVVTQPETDSAALKTLMVRRGTPGAEGICRVEGGGADYYRVAPEAGDIEIGKLLFNSFHGTDLDEQLRARGVDTVVMTGLSTDCCVDATARDAFHRGYNVLVVSDACAAYEPEVHASALSLMEKNVAMLVESEAVATAWHAAARE